MYTLLPKQTEINKILRIIERKILKGTHLPIPLKVIWAGYLTRLYFKDIYLYPAQNKLSSSKVAVRQVETQAERYLLPDSLLLRI